MSYGRGSARPFLWHSSALDYSVIVEVDDDDDEPLSHLLRNEYIEAELTGVEYIEVENIEVEHIEVEHIRLNISACSRSSTRFD
jgi:hypothetical protein